MFPQIESHEIPASLRMYTVYIPTAPLLQNVCMCECVYMLGIWSFVVNEEKNCLVQNGHCGCDDSHVELGLSVLRVRR